MKFSLRAYMLMVGYIAALLTIAMVLMSRFSASSFLEVIHAKKKAANRFHFD